MKAFFQDSAQFGRRLKDHDESFRLLSFGVTEQPIGHFALKSFISRKTLELPNINRSIHNR